MPLKIPTLDDRRYQDLLDEALARIPVHNPEWTNFNKSDPGVTLIEVFSFLTENLLYRANQVPERNRRKFLSLLGMPLQSAAPAHGLVTFANERGPLAAFTLNGGLEVRAGKVPFRTGLGLDVLPIEGRIYYKRLQKNLSNAQTAYYRQLYASFFPEEELQTGTLQLYETVTMPEPTPASTGVDLASADVVDGLWIALLVRANEKDPDALEKTRQAIGGKTLSLGVVPSLSDAERLLNPVGQVAPDEAARLRFEMPASGSLPADRQPTYRSLPAEADVNVLSVPGVIQISLPEAPLLQLWNNLDPLELGVGAFPPALEDTKLNERLITWLHVTVPPGIPSAIYWLGINATTISQGSLVTNERLPDGNGEPDQTASLSRTPVIPGTVTLRITDANGSKTWHEIDDLISAGPEVPGTLASQTIPGMGKPQPAPTEVFTLDAEAGLLRFGDGTHGRRPPAGAAINADYTYSVGAAGNVGAGSVNNSPALPSGIKVSNPLPTWGGVDAESQAEAEKHIPRYLQHRDRLVTVADFETITYRTPGADVARVEVLPAYHPRHSTASGDAPGMVSLVVIPYNDPLHADTPEPSKNFLDAICTYLNPRRLVTTELYLCGPEYQPIWVSVGIQTQPGVSVAEVREGVKSALYQFLSPLPPVSGMPVDETITNYASGSKGWPLGKPVVALELAAVASRVHGVMAVKNILLYRGNSPAVQAAIPMQGIQLPRVAGMSVVVGDPLTADQLGLSGTTPPVGPKPLPVPIIPEECR
jgi:hypothetical protein